MHHVIGMLEGHWPAHFVSITYSSYHFRRSFVPTTWHHPLFPCTVRREDRVHRGRSSRRIPDYNLLLGRSWTYAMQAVVATVFWVLLFPHEGRIMTIDQLSFS
jgi:hypothetical protein